MIKIIYIDMDGVLANMHGRFLQLSGGKLPAEVGPKEFWAIVRKADERMRFFETLEPMPDIEMLMGAITAYDAANEILTSSGRPGTDWHLQKERWIRKCDKLDDDIPFNYVHRGIDKAQYARPDALLIDDKLANCDAFIAAGGHAIYHQDAATTAAKLYVLSCRKLLKRKGWCRDSTRAA